MVRLVLSSVLYGCAIVTTFAVPKRNQTQEAYDSVATKVQDRSGQLLRWEKDEVTREQNLAEARRLLRRPLTIKAAVQIALLNNPQLQATLEEVGIALADFRQAGYLANPTLNVNPQIPDHSPRSPEWDYGLTASLLDALFIPLRKQLAGKALEEAKLRVASEALQLVANVKSVFYELLGDEQTFDQLQTVKQALDASLLLTQKQFEAGNITDVALGLQQVEYSQVRLDLAEIDAKQLEDHEKLNRLLGLFGSDTNWTTAERVLPKLPDRDLPDRGLETLAVAQRYDLAARRQALETVLQQLGILDRYRFFSSLDIGVGGTRNTDGSNQIGPSLSIQVPLFDQGQAKLARGAARLRQTQRSFENLAIEIRSEVRELRDRLAARRRSAEFYQADLLPFRRRLLAGQQLQYNAMIVGPFDLFRTRVDEIQTERNYINVLKDYWQARAELERAVGGGFTMGPKPSAEKEIMTKNDQQ
jgi:outer membrane protein, heavy metal efflux system